MVKNRYFKNTLGIFAELVIAGALDVEETSGTSAQPSVASITIGIAADPTPGDLINIVVDGVTYTHTVPEGDETTQQAHDAILALLQANTQGFTVTAHSGTTTSVYQLAWGNGTANNDKVISSTETGSTFTAFADATFAGGVDADAAAADDLEAFVTSSNAGTMWAFWEDTKTGLVTGDTKKASNLNRKFFYAWKDADGKTHTTTAIPVMGLRYDSAAYNAGQVQISKIKYAGTVSATQIVHIKIMDTSATHMPYPHWEYDQVFTTDIATTLTALAAKIAAETDEPIVTASASSDEITVTGLYKNRTFKVTGFIEVTATAATDASAISFPTSGTQPAKAPIGDADFIEELAEYYNIYNGGINYAPEGTKISEWQTGNDNTSATSQWGILMVSSAKEEDGIVRNHTAKAYVIVAVPTASVAALAAL